MFTTALVLSLLACSGGAPEATTDAAPGDATPPDADAPAPEEGGIVAPIACDPGTSAQMAETDKGREFWCDKGGLMHGAFVRLHPNGEKAAEGKYTNNLPDGSWIWWYENGVEMKKGKYVKGKQTGSWTFWYENGTRKEEGDYLQGRKQGTWTSWYESGRRSEEGNYHNGMKNALWTYFEDTEENEPIRTELWKNGHLAEEKELKKKDK